MTTTPQNAPCPCGSGKKYKRCCGEINSKKRNKNAKITLEEFIEKYNSTELLKIVSLIQLQALNHGKNIRLEILVSNIVNKINTKNSRFDYKILSQELKSICKFHHAEDPPQSFFTENIVHSTGNNIVFPGISLDGKETIQGLVNVIMEADHEKNLPADFIDEANQVLHFMLSIHDNIARSLGYSWRRFQESKSMELFVPPTEKIKEQKEMFSFSQVQVDEIAKKFNISKEIIDDFVYEFSKEQIPIDDFDCNPLLKKPFIRINNSLILVLPTAQLFSINEKLVELALKHNCLNDLVDNYNDNSTQQVTTSLIKMKWHQVNFDFEKIDKSLLDFSVNELLARFDNDKLAYVNVIGETPATTQNSMADILRHSSQLINRASIVIEVIRGNYPNHKLFYVFLINKYKLLNQMGFALNEIPGADAIIGIGKNELEILVQNWDFDNLTLWKYIKYYDAARHKIEFVPLTSHIAKFQWYKRNYESFFDTDEKNGNYFFFTLDIEGDEWRKAIKALDKIGIPYVLHNAYGYFQCIKRDKRLPIYISQSFQIGFLSNCLVKYSCPIWIESRKRGDYLADVYMNAILYWLNEIYDETMNFINQLGEAPLILEITLDEKLYNLTSLTIDEEAKTSIVYSIDISNRRIEFTIPVQIVNYLADSGNQGERILIRFLLDAIGDLLNKLGIAKRLSNLQVRGIMNKYFDYPNKKMILHSDGRNDPNFSDVDLIPERFIPDADISCILENQLEWLKPSKPIPIVISSANEKVDLMNSLVSLHFRKIREKLFEFPFTELLIHLMQRNEAMVRERSYRKLAYPAKLACYSKYYNVYEEFSKSENELVKTSLALRVLIEFVASEKPEGSKIVSEDEVDILLSFTSELINYGFGSDAIYFGIENPKMGLLDSGRLGIQKDVNNNYVARLRDDVHSEELDDYSLRFKNLFDDQIPKEQNKKQKDLANKIEKAFLQDWGISLWTIFDIFHFLASICFNNNKSVLIKSEREIIDEIKEQFNLEETKILFFLDKFCLVDRKSILEIPAGFRKEHIYPWRYGRPLSYLNRPLVRINIQNISTIFLSSRHILMAAENLVSMIYDATFKTKKEEKNIEALLGFISRKKGRDFRNEIAEWLSKNTSLNVLPFEVKISDSGYFRSQGDKGDIDILAIDNFKKIIYSLECKNTSQSKVSFEFKSEIDSFLGKDGKEGLIHKHIKRHEWMEKNKSQVYAKLGLNNSFAINSKVITNNILPLNYIISAPLQIISFYDLKSKKFIF